MRRIFILIVLVFFCQSVLGETPTMQWGNFVNESFNQTLTDSIYCHQDGTGCTGSNSSVHSLINASGFYNSSKINTTQLQEQSDSRLGILWSWFVSSWLDRFNAVFPSHNTTLVTYINDKNNSMKQYVDDTKVNVTGDNMTGDLNVNADFFARFYKSIGTGLKFNWRDNGNDLTLNVTGASGGFEIEQDNAKLALFNEATAGNDFKTFQVFSKVGVDVSEFVIHQVSFNLGDHHTGSLQVGATQGNCSGLTRMVDCWTAGTGADLVIQDEIWSGGGVFLANGSLNVTDSGNVFSENNMTAIYFLGNGSQLTSLTTSQIGDLLSLLSTLITGNITAENASINARITNENLTQRNHIEAESGNLSSYIVSNNATLKTYIDEQDLHINNSQTNFTQQYVDGLNLVNDSSDINTTQLQFQSDNRLGILWSWFVSAFLDRFNAVFPAHNTTLVTYINQQNTTQDNAIKFINSNMSSYVRTNNATLKTYIDAQDLSINTSATGYALTIVTENNNTIVVHFEDYIATQFTNNNSYWTTNNATMAEYAKQFSNSTADFEDSFVDVAGDTMTGQLIVPNLKLTGDLKGSGDTFRMDIFQNDSIINSWTYIQLGGNNTDQDQSGQLILAGNEIIFRAGSTNETAGINISSMNDNGLNIYGYLTTHNWTNVSITYSQITDFVTNNNTLDTAIKFINSNLSSYIVTNNATLKTYIDQQNTTQQNHIEAESGNLSAYLVTNNGTVTTYIDAQDLAINNSATQFTQTYVDEQGFYNSSKINTTQLQEQSDSRLGILWSWFVDSWNFLMSLVSWGGDLFGTGTSPQVLPNSTQLDADNITNKQKIYNDSRVLELVLDPVKGNATNLTNYMNTQNTTQDTAIKFINSNLSSYIRDNNDTQDTNIINENTTQANHIEAESGNLSSYIRDNNVTQNQYINDRDENVSNYNLTAYMDLPSGSKNIYSWFINSSPFMILNMPFQGINSTAENNSWDYSGHGHNAREGPTANWTANSGYDGHDSYQFKNIAGSYLDVGRSDAIKRTCLNGCTFSTRIKINDSLPAPSGFRQIIARSDSTSSGFRQLFEFRLTNFISNTVQFQVWHNGSSNSNSCTATSSAIVNNTWYHVTAKYNLTHTAVYIDGEQADQTPCSTFSAPEAGNWTASDTNLSIGATWLRASTQGFFHGNIDDVMIWNKSLTFEQINAIYRNKTDTIVAEETSIDEIWGVDIYQNNGTVDTAIGQKRSVIIRDDVFTLDASPKTPDINFNQEDCLLANYNPTTNAYDISINETCLFQHKFKGLSSDGLTMYLSGDGYYHDSSGWGNDGFSSGAGVTFTNTSRFGRAFNFSHTTDHVTIPADPSLDSNGTSIVAWIRPDTVTAGFGGIVTKNDSSPSLRPFSCWQNSGEIEIWYGNGHQLSSPSQLVANEWHHIVCQYDQVNDNLTIFINGQLVASDTTGTNGGPPIDTDNPVIVGFRGHNVQDYSGQIDEVMWWNRSLDSSEIEELFNQGRQYVPLSGLSRTADQPVVGHAIMNIGASASTSEVRVGLGVTENEYLLNTAWNGTHYSISNRGTYRISLNAQVSCSTVTVYLQRIRVNGVEQERITPNCHSSTDPKPSGLEIFHCLESGDFVAGSIDGAGSTMTLGQTSGLYIEKISKTCESD